MEKVVLPREFLYREVDCDNHNLQEAINLMGGQLDKKLMQFTRKLVIDMRKVTRDHNVRITNKRIKNVTR